MRLHAACPTLVSRERELNGLLALAADVEGGRGDLVLLTGDAGIGKTRLVQEFRHRLGGRMRVIEGRCSPAAHAEPFAPFMDALRFRLARGEAAEASIVLGPLLGHLAPLFPELAGSASGAVSVSDFPPERVFELCSEVVRRLAVDQPLLLLLEDFHWADATSRDLLHHLARGITEVPLLLVVTARTDELHIGHPVRRLFATLARERVAHTIVLAPLERDGVAAMIEATLSAKVTNEVADVFWRRSEGNPLFVEELVKTMLDATPGNSGAPNAAVLAQAQLPASISEAILGRIEPLGDDAREVLSIAAVIGREFDFELLRAATRRPESELLEIVERLVSRHLLIDAGGLGEERYAFRHGVIREVVYQSAIARRRRGWHRAVAEALERMPVTRRHQPHQALAHHYRLGGDVTRAAEHAMRAGDEASRLSAWADAEAHYRTALEALEGSVEANALEPDLLERLSYVMWWRGRLDEARRYAEDALERRRASGDRVRSAALLRRLALLHAHQRGDWFRAESALREALVLLGDDADPREETLTTVDLGRLCLARGSLVEAERWMERGLALAVSSRTEGEEALALALLGMLAIVRADVRAGVARLDVALGLMQDQDMPLERATSVFNAGIRALEKAREHDRAIQWIDAGVTFAARHGAHADSAIFRAHRAAVERDLGRLDDAHVMAAQAVDELRAARRAELRDAIVILGDTCRVRGDTQGARTAYREARDLGDPYADVGEALVLLAEDKAAEAAVALSGVLDARPPGHHLLALRVLPALVEAYVRAGDAVRAIETLRRLEAEVERSDYRVGPHALRHAEGLVLAMTGDLAGARSALQAAIENWADAGFPFERARSLAALAGVILDSAEDPEEGIRVGRSALDAFERLGAGAEADRVRRLLRRAGARWRAARGGPPSPHESFGLTAREREVLGQLALGFTNRQIAGALGIAEKTVSIHISHILAKLGCSTRTQAVRVAVDEGMLQDMA